MCVFRSIHMAAFLLRREHTPSVLWMQRMYSVYPCSWTRIEWCVTWRGTITNGIPWMINKMEMCSVTFRVFPHKHFKTIVCNYFTIHFDAITSRHINGKALRSGQDHCWIIHVDMKHVKHPQLIACNKMTKFWTFKFAPFFYGIQGNHILINFIPLR